MEYQSPLTMLYHWERTTPDKVYLKQPIDAVWHTWTWQQVAAEVRQLAASLQALELPRHSHIAVLSKNCAHWIICDLAIMMAGHVSVPLYPNLQQEAVQQILERSESVVLFVGKLDHWDSVKSGVSPKIKCIAFPFCSHENCETWSNFVGSIQPIQQDINSKATDLCSIIYTSGTVGAPKGAMFSFDAFAFATQHAIEHLHFKNSDRFFSYLPLSHVAERMLVEMVSLYTGGEVSFANRCNHSVKILRKPGQLFFWAYIEYGPSSRKVYSLNFLKES
jgi:long-subunit acyl-CoA synthetase (AMP-forming)